MTFRDDALTDYLVHEEIETVTFTPDDGTPLPTVHAKWGPLTREARSLAGDIEIAADDAGVSLFVTTLSGKVPRKGNTVLRSDGKTWIVLGAKLLRLRTRWLCLMRQRPS
jgi:hypothetical protein